MLRFLLGVALGVAFAIGYVQWGFDLPDKLNLAAKLRGGVVSAAIEDDLYDLQIDEPRRLRALEVLFANRAAFAAGVDAQLGHPFLAALYRVRAVREARVLNISWQAFDKALSQPALRGALARRHGTEDTAEIKSRMLGEAFAKQPFLAKWMAQNGYPSDSGSLLASLKRIGDLSPKVPGQAPVRVPAQ